MYYDTYYNDNTSSNTTDNYYSQTFNLGESFEFNVYIFDGNYYNNDKGCAGIYKDCIHRRVVGFCAYSYTEDNDNYVVIAIATPLNEVYLFQCNADSDLPECLVDLLEDDQIVKVNVMPEDDSSLLSEDFNIDVESTLDLGILFKRPFNLKYFAKMYLKYEYDDYYSGLNDDFSDLKDFAANEAFTALELFKFWAGFRSLNGPPFWRDIKPKIEDLCGEKYSDYVTMPQNPCVVCGSLNATVSKHIVPAMYTQHFEERECLVDNLLLCLDCERRTHNAYMHKLTNTLKYASGLLLKSDRIFKKIEKESKNAIRYEPHKSDTVTTTFLRECQDWIICDIPDDAPESDAGYYIVQYFNQNNQPLYELENLWCNMFIEAMDPQFMPRHWPM